MTVVRTKFFIGGAPKAGTTALWNYLSQHPEIYMGTEKEIYFFTHRWHLGVDWYNSLYPDYKGQKMVGDGSINILGSRDAPDKIRKYVTEPKFIFLLRNPVTRLWSDYNWGCLQGHFAHLTFEEYLKEPTTEWNMSVGRYVEGLRFYENQFSRESILPLFHDHFMKSPEETLRTVCQFLGVNESFTFQREVKNVGTYKTPTFVLRQLYAAKRKIPSNWNAFPSTFTASIKRLFSVEGKMRIETKKRLIEYYIQSILELEDYLKCSLDHWKR